MSSDLLHTTSPSSCVFPHQPLRVIPSLCLMGPKCRSPHLFVAYGQACVPAIVVLTAICLPCHPSGAAMLGTVALRLSQLVPGSVSSYHNIAWPCHDNTDLSISTFLRQGPLAFLLLCIIYCLLHSALPSWRPWVTH